MPESDGDGSFGYDEWGEESPILYCHLTGHATHPNDVCAYATDLTCSHCMYAQHTRINPRITHHYGYESSNKSDSRKDDQPKEENRWMALEL